MPIRNLQHVAMRVQDLEVGRRLYGDFGLEYGETNGSLLFRCRDRDQDQIRLTEGPVKQRHYISLGTIADEISDIKSALNKAGAEIIDCPAELAGCEGIWARDFEGMQFNIQAADEMPWNNEIGYAVNSPAERNRIGRRHEFFDYRPIYPRRLGHAVLFTSDLKRKTLFLEQAFGFMRSDSVGPFMDFYCLSTGSDHHILAAIQSHAPGLQHIAFEVAIADEVHYGGRRVLDKGYIDAWGPGRHAGPGSNLFHYIRDPWSSCVEYFADMNFTPEGANWEALPYVPGELPDFWGPSVQRQFNTNFEAINTKAERL